MLAHCNEPLCVLRKHTQSPTLITEEETGYSSSPQQEQWKERGICKFFHPLMTHNLLGRWVFCRRALIDMSSIMMEWVRSKSWEKCHSQAKWSRNGSQSGQWSSRCLFLLGLVVSDHLYVRQHWKRFGTQLRVQVSSSTARHTWLHW